MNLTIEVLHNVSPDMFWKYHPDTSKLYHAHTFEVVADDAERGASIVWDLANVDSAQDLIGTPLEQYGEQVTAYRARMNRSLSVSDVLVIREDKRLCGVLVVASIGFDGLEFMPKYAPGSNKTAQSISYCAHQALMQRERRS